MSAVVTITITITVDGGAVAVEQKAIPLPTVEMGRSEAEYALTPPSSGGEGEELGVPSGRDAPSDEHSTPRSLAADASDSTEPVEPARKDGSAGGRGPDIGIPDAEIDVTIPAHLDRRPESRRAGT